MTLADVRFKLLRIYSKPEDHDWMDLAEILIDVIDVWASHQVQAVEPGTPIPDHIQQYGERVGEIIDLKDQLAKSKAEVNRLKGLIHSELLTTMEYCETHEMAYQLPEGAPVKCPWCELALLEALLLSDPSSLG